MRALSVLAVLFLAQACMAYAGEYSIIVEENGNALVLLMLEGDGTAYVPLPEDVTYPQVFNAIYVDSPGGVEVSLAGNESVTVAYRTSMLAFKRGGSWVLEKDFAGNYSVLVSIPPNAAIMSTEPSASYQESEDSKNLIWDSADYVRLEYGFDQSFTSSTTLPAATTTSTTVPAKQESNNPAYLLVPLTLLALAAAAAFLWIVRKKTPTDGMEKLMRTLTGNEYKVVDTLLRNGKGMKRSDLERSAGLSKSSLALALTSLERKNIVEVDRRYSTHYVEVTKWFKGL